MYKKPSVVFVLLMVVVATAQVVPTNEWVSFWDTSSTINSSSIPVGSVIKAYDPDGVLCGIDTVDVTGAYGAMPVYRDDTTTTDVDEGADPGDVITFTINSVTVPETSTWTSYGDVIQLDLHALIPYIGISSSALDFGQVTVNTTTSLDLTISNIGGTDLMVSDIDWNESIFSVSDTSAALLPGDSLVVTVSFAFFLGYGIVHDTLVISSNDPVTPLITVPITGEIITDVIPTNEWVSFYSLNSTFDAASLNIGDVVDAYDPTGVHCGVWVVNTVGAYGLMAVYRDDAMTPSVDEGTDPGDVVTFKINGRHATPLGPENNVWTFYGDVLEVNLEGFPNRPPAVVSPIADVVMNEDDPDLVLADLDDVFDDPDVGDTLTYSAEISDSNVSYDIDGDNVVTISLAQDWFGSATLIVTATDLEGEVATDTVEITVYPVNDAPVVEGIPDTSFAEDDSTQIDLDDYVSDRDHDLSSLVWTVSPVGAGNQLLHSGKKGNVSSYLFFIPASSSKVVGKKKGRFANVDGRMESLTQLAGDSISITIDSVTHIATFTATLNYHVYDVDFEFTATDPGDSSGSGTMSVTVTPVNDSPKVMSPIGDVTINEDALDLVLADLDTVFDDVDGDTLSFSGESDTSAVTITIDGENRAIISLAADWNGTATLVFTATDNSDFASDTVTLEVSPVNDAPGGFELLKPDDEATIVITPDNLGDNLRFEWGASEDVDGDSVTYNLVGGEQLTFLIAEGIEDTELVWSFSELADAMGTLDIAEGIWTIMATDGDSITGAGNGPFILTIDKSAVSIDESELIPEVFALYQNYPNPFNPVTTIRFDIPEVADVRVEIYNLLGQKVKTLVANKHQPGFYRVVWNGHNDLGRVVMTGVYIYRITAKNPTTNIISFSKTHKLVLIK